MEQGQKNEVVLYSIGNSVKFCSGGANMLRKSLNVLAVGVTLALGVSYAAAGDAPQSGAKLSAAAIVEKNVAARCGLQAWRSAHALTFTVKIGAARNTRAA